MTTAMENIKEMVDVNTIVGDPVESPDGSVIIPVSKVGFGFAAGGSEFKGTEQGSPGGVGGNNEDGDPKELPFGGGSGGGVSITPIGFLVVNDKGIRMLNIDRNTHLFDRLLDMAPHMMDRLQQLTKGKGKKSCSDESNAGL